MSSHITYHPHFFKSGDELFLILRVGRRAIIPHLFMPGDEQQEERKKLAHDLYLDFYPSKGEA